MKRTQKEQEVVQFKKILEQSGGTFFMAFRGMKVPQESLLRRQVKKAGCTYKVVKNTLLMKAMEGMSFRDAFGEKLEGPTAVAYIEKDPAVLAKTLVDFVKTNPALSFKAAIVEGNYVSKEQIAEIASLPSRKELVAKLVYILKSPIGRLVNVLNDPLRRFGVVMHQVAEKKVDQPQQPS